MEYLDEMKKEIKPIKRRKSGAVVELTMAMLSKLMDDCPNPTNNEFRKMLGLQMALMNGLGVNLLNSMRDDKKLDRELLRLAMKVFEMSRSAASAGAAIKSDSDQE